MIITDDLKVQRKPRVKTPFEQINDLIAELQAEDYKITKCNECFLTNRPLPYDIDALTQKRDAIRDEINKLEKQL